MIASSLTYESNLNKFYPDAIVRMRFIISIQFIIMRYISFLQSGHPLPLILNLIVAFHSWPWLQIHHTIFGLTIIQAIVVPIASAQTDKVSILRPALCERFWPAVLQPQASLPVPGLPTLRLYPPKSFCCIPYRE